MHRSRSLTRHWIEPLGASLANGFRVVLRKGAPNSRQRFTVAHEICHTFFYEAAPELKLGANHEDPFEEALCNYGASCLLMPEDVIRPNALVSNPCLASLETLSQLFAVSHEAMIVRLRDLGLWRCEYSLWHRMTTGEFAIERLYGWPRINWNWADVSLPASTLRLAVVTARRPGPYLETWYPKQASQMIDLGFWARW